MKKKISTLTIVVTVFLLTLTQCKKSSFKNEECFRSDDCNLKGQTGSCYALTPGYYYDKDSKKCVEFLWGGCGGVLPFATMEECEKNCHCKWKI